MEQKTGDADKVAQALVRIKEICGVVLTSEALTIREAAVASLEVEDESVRGELMGRLRDALAPPGVRVISLQNRQDALLHLGIEVTMAEAMREVQWLAPYLMYMAEAMRIARVAELGDLLGDINVAEIDPFGYISAVDSHEIEDERYTAALLIDLIKRIPIEYEVYPDEFIEDIVNDLPLAVMNVFGTFAQIGYDPDEIMTVLMKEVFEPYQS
jgi:hypothetical protein